jgi:hypothetical protein
MARFSSMARSAWRCMQASAVFALCIGAAMVLPVTLAAVGFHTL